MKATKTQLAALKKTANELRYFFQCRTSGARFNELVQVIKKQEKQHSSSFPGKRAPLHYRTDYFLVLTMYRAFAFWAQNDTDRQFYVGQLAGLRTDFLIAIAIVGQYQQALEEYNITWETLYEGLDSRNLDYLNLCNWS